MSKLRRCSKRSYPKLLSKAKQIFQRYIRLRDSNYLGEGECVTCGSKYRWSHKAAQGGHFIPAKKGGTCFDERNVHFQCLTLSLIHI